MCLVVGHNDAGYLPLTDPIEVNDLKTAIQVLINEVTKWFEPELDGEELTQEELLSFYKRVRELRQRSTLILRGHAFWIQ